MSLLSDPTVQASPPIPAPAAPARAADLGSGTPALPKPRAAKHIPALDGVRGLAILLVMVFHFAGLSYSQLPWAVQRLLGAGWVGVDLFFVLSGFLITSILCEAKGSAGYFKNFYMRRVLRIFPLYYGVLAVAAVVGAVYAARLPGEYQVVREHQWALWVYVQNFVAIDWRAFSHFWSLAVEEHFYMVWPAVVFLLSRRGAMAVCVGLIVTAVGVRVGRELMVPTGDPAAVALWREATYTWTICRMDALAIGSLLALAAHGVPAGVARFRPAAPWVLIGAAVAAGAMFVVHGTFAYVTPSIQVAGFTVNALASAALLVLAVTAGTSGWLGRAFGATWLRFLGKYSYGTYVFHMFVMTAFRELLPLKRLRPMVGDSAAGATAVYLVGGTLLSLGLALLCWHLYEKHFLKFKRFFEYRAPTIEGFRPNEPVRG
jgi:peptidoglycan/LPS O-acetylase OafA/YrhL